MNLKEKNVCVLLVNFINCIMESVISFFVPYDIELKTSRIFVLQSIINVSVLS